MDNHTLAVHLQAIATTAETLRADLHSSRELAHLHSGLHTLFTHLEILRTAVNSLGGDLAMPSEALTLQQAAALRQSEQRYRSVLRSMDEGYALCEVVYDDAGAMDLIYIEVNPAFERLLGLVGAAGRTASQLNLVIEPHWKQIYEQVIETRKSVRIEDFSPSLRRWYSVQIAPVDGDFPNRVATIFDDITERRLAAHELEGAAARDAYRVRLTDVLRPLSDPVQMHTEASRIMGEHFGVQRVMFAEVDRDDAIIYQDFTDGVPSLVGRYPLHLFGLHLSAVLRRGETLILNDIAADGALTEEQHATYRLIQTGASVTAGLIKQGRWVAALSLHSRAPRVWTPDEVALLEETADRLWDAIERARAQAALQASEAAQRFLLRMSDATRTIADPGEVMAITTSLVAEQIQADRAYFGEIDSDHIIIHRDYVRDGLPLAGIYPIDFWGDLVIDIYKHGGVTVVDDIRTHPLFINKDISRFERAGLIAGMLVPLPTTPEWGALLCVSSTQPRGWTDEEVRIVTESAERTWAAVERARAEAALRNTEALLQKTFSAQTVGVLFFTLEGRITDSNVTFARMSGYTREELLTLGCHALIAPGFDAMTIDAVTMLATEGETAPHEIQLVRKDGSLWWALVAPVRVSGSGMTALCIEFIIDITPQKEVEAYEREQRILAEALRETAEQFSSTLRLSEVLEHGLSSARRLIFYDIGYIVLIDAQQKMIQFHAEGLTQRERDTIERWHGQQPDLTALPLYGSSVQALPLQHITDRALIHPLLPYADAPALVIVPLAQPRIIGYLVCVLRDAQPLSGPRSAAMQAFAYQLTTAIGNARLFVGAQELAALKERQHFARDLHDAVSQTLFTASLMVETLPILIRDNSPNVTPTLSDVQRLIRGAQAEMRSLLLELRPANLESTPLKRLLNQLIDAIQGRKHIEIDLECQTEPDIPWEVRVMVYRIAQEALNNISKHARAEHAWVYVRGGPGAVVLSIRDDGQGFAFDPAHPTNGMGLQMMRERADDVGAALRLHSAPGEGTFIELIWPKKQTLG